MPQLTTLGEKPELLAMEIFMDYGLTKVIGAMNGIIVLQKLGKLPNIDGAK